MTLKDYADIQRSLGYIEGMAEVMALRLNEEVNIRIFEAISVIDAIIDKEVEEDG